MTEQFKAATIRALYGAILTCALAFITAMQTLSGSDRVEDAALIAASSFLGYMITRGVAEGMIDSNRDPTPADVGQTTSTVVQLD